MANRKIILPQYGTVMKRGVLYYRTRIKDANGKLVAIYAKTPEELYNKETLALEQIENATFHRKTPTVAEYCEKWLLMQSVHVRATTLTDYTSKVRRHIIAELGDKRMGEVSLDDIQLALVPVSKKSASVYKSVVILYKSIFRAAMESRIIDHNPTIYLTTKGGGVPQEDRQALTDEQAERLLDAIRDLPPYVFVMIGLYAGLRREEILALQWDSVYLDTDTPYLTVRRAWHTEHNRPVISDELKTKAAERNIPLPVCLAECLKAAKETSTSEYVVSNRDGEPLSYTQFKRLWQYIVTRTVKERSYYRYEDGKRVKHTVTPVLGEKAAHNGKVVYSLDLSLYAATCEELYEKQLEARKQVEEIIFHRQHPTVAEYGEKWLLMQSAKVSASTLRGYTRDMTNYIIKPLGEMYMEEVTADDIRLALVPLSKKSEGLYNKVNMLLKCIFYAAERNQILEHNPCAGISGKGGKPTKKKEALTDQQVAVLLDTVKGLPPYLFIMLGLYSGLRREEILALQWDCVFLDEDTPYLSVRRAWRTEHNRPVISTVLKTPAAKRDIPIPKCLVECLREAKENSISDYVIADSKGEPLAASQFQRVWQYVVVRSTKPRNYYKYVNGESIKYTVTPTLGMTQKNQPKIKYTLDFDVTPHQLRHTYITNLLYAGVDPKTVQYLAGHENSKTTMDIYAKVKYNKPEELFGVVNGAFHQAIAE